MYNYLLEYTKHGTCSYGLLYLSHQVTFSVSLERFSNPSDHKMDDTRCDDDSMCDLVMTLCISTKSSPR